MARFLEISSRIQESTTTQNETLGLASRLFRVRSLSNRPALGGGRNEPIWDGLMEL